MQETAPLKDRKISISPSIIVFSVLFLLGLFFLYKIVNILILLFLAFIIVVALRPSVTRLEQKLKFPRIISILIVYTLMLVFLSAIVGFILPPLLSELYQLVKTINYPFIQQYVRNIQLSVSEITNIAQNFSSSLNVVFSIITSTFSGVFTFITLLIMSFYLMLDRPRLHQKLAWFTKNQTYIQIAEDFLNSLEKQLGGWVRGQILLMTLIGIITYAGLALLSIPFALPLALMAGLLEVVPNLGPTIAAIPAIAIAFIYLNPTMAFVMLIFYIVVQQLENNILVPKIMKDNADVNPLVAIVCILIGLQLYHVMGALLAVPLYIVLRTTYSTWRKLQKN